MNANRCTHALTTALILLVLASSLQVPSAPLSQGDLSSRSGSGFWSDPCTWDGFITGAGAVLCGFGHAGGCVSALVGITAAVKVHSCF